MRIELIIDPQVIPKPTSVLNISGLFRNCLPTKRSALRIGTVTMSLGIVNYDPKHAVGFGSVANLVKAGNIMIELL